MTAAFQLENDGQDDQEEMGDCDTDYRGTSTCRSSLIDNGDLRLNGDDG